MHHLRMRQRRDAHLEGDARDAAKGFVDVEDLFPNGFGIADNERAGGTSQRIELCSRSGRPSPFFADFREGVGIAGKEVVRGLLIRIAEKADAVKAHLQLLWSVAGAATRLAIEFDVGTKAVRFAADDRNH